MRTDLVEGAVRRHLPDYDVRSIQVLGEGVDHGAYEINGELVVRVDSHRDAGRTSRVRRECRLLTTVAAVAPVSVPRPVFCSAEDGVLAYRKLDGQRLLDVPRVRRIRLALPVAATLGHLLAVLHAMPPETVDGLVDVDDAPLEEWREEAGRLLPAVAEKLKPRVERAVGAFLAAPLPSSSPYRVFSHNDLGIEHVLVHPATGTVTGVLDWSDAAITDPARDFGLILRDLGPAGLNAALDAYGVVGEDQVEFGERVAFYGRCAALEDVAYGLRTGQAAYVQNCVAALDWLFP